MVHFTALVDDDVGAEVLIYFIIFFTFSKLKIVASMSKELECFIS
jgi:hypothetical protein